MLLFTMMKWLTVWRKASLRVSHAPCSVEVVRRKQEKTQ